MVSVIIVSYNRERYIREAILSVLNQNYQDYELIVVDDGSNDNTKKIVDDYKERLRYIYIEHKGCSTARNIGIENAKGEYIVWVDSDDMLLPHTLTVEKEEFIKDPKVDIVYGDFYIIDREGEVKSILKHESFSTKEELISTLALRNPIPNPGTMIRKECFQKWGNFDPLLPRSHDYDLWVRMSRYCNFKYINVPVYKWRAHEESMSWGDRAKLYNKDDAEVLRRMIKMFSLKELFPTIKWEELTKEEGNALAYNNIAKIFTVREAYKDAISYYKKSIEEIPNEKAYFEGGILLFRIGENKEGIRWIKEAKRLNPDLFLNKENISTIQKLREEDKEDILQII